MFTPSLGDTSTVSELVMFMVSGYRMIGITPVSQEILSLGNFVARQNFLAKSVAATIFPRKFCRSILTQRPHFLGNSVALLHRDTLPRSTAEFDIGGGTRGHWGPVPPLMSREEAASYIGNAVAALK